MRDERHEVGAERGEPAKLLDRRPLGLVRTDVLDRAADETPEQAEELDLETRAKQLQDTATQAAKQAREKAGDYAAQNRDKIDGYVETATTKIDEKTEGKYADKVAKVREQVGRGVDKIAEMFRKSGLDTVVFDIADVGARFYTYIWMMYQTMQAAVAVGASIVVLDRPNPVGGQAHGPQLDPAYSSFVGLRPVVQQHGMTIGELASLFDAEFLPADTGRRLEQLQVVELRGWKRSDLFDATEIEEAFGKALDAQAKRRG